MKIKNNFLILGILFLLIGITGCGFKSPSISTSSPVITQTSVVPTVTQTPQPTSTTTITPVTLSNDELWAQRHKSIIAFLEATNNSCILPCLGGITPGRSNWMDAERILNDVGIVTHENPLSPDLMSNGWKDFFIAGVASYPEGIIQTGLDFYVRNGVVDHIIVNSQGNYSFSDQIPAFRKMWENYSAEKLIPELGVPSRVSIYSTITPGEGQTTGSAYDIYLFYDAQGILLEYRVNNGLDSMYKICPIFGKGGNTEDRITMILKSPDDGIPIENYEPAYNSTSFLDLEKAAGITTEEFYKLFLQTGKPVCFNTLPSVLPKP